jgi:hypothetical protein
MGGDGGVIASNRKYMRGAGTASHTADAAKRESRQQQETTCQECMTTCYLTKSPLDYSEAIVCCPYGRLYRKEAALSALIRRKQSSTTIKDNDKNKEHDHDELGSHIRGIKDLTAVRFCLQGNKVVCPVTHKELNGKIPAMVMVPGKANKANKDTTPNVLSEGAFARLSKKELEMEYGPIEYKIRLAPPLELLKEIQEQLAKDPKRHKLKKRKRDPPPPPTLKEEHHHNHNHHKLTASHTSSGKVADVARTRIASAVESNQVLSSLFTAKKHISEKDHKDNLFAR